MVREAALSTVAVVHVLISIQFTEENRLRWLMSNYTNGDRNYMISTQCKTFCQFGHIWVLLWLSVIVRVKVCWSQNIFQHYSIHEWSFGLTSRTGICSGHHPVASYCWWLHFCCFNFRPFSNVKNRIGQSSASNCRNIPHHFQKKHIRYSLTESFYNTCLEPTNVFATTHGMEACLCVL